MQREVKRSMKCQDMWGKKVLKKRIREWKKTSNEEKKKCVK